MIVVFGWRVFFAVTGLAGTTWLVAWLFSIRLWKSRDPSAMVQNNAKTTPSLQQSLRLLHNRRIAVVFFGYFAYDYAWFLLLRWMPVYLTVERKFSPREMALAVLLVLTGQGLPQIRSCDGGGTK